MDVGVAVRRQHLAVGGQRVVELDMGGAAVAAERPVAALAVREHDHEVAEPLEPAFDALSGRQDDGRRHGRRFGVLAAAPDPGVLQFLRLGNPGGDAREVAGRRVAGGALLDEVGPAGGGVAHENVELGLFAEGRPPLAGRGAQDVVHVGHHRLEVVVGQRLRGHVRPARPRLAVADHRPHQFAGLVPQHELRPQQVGSAEVAAPQVPPVARPAVDAVEGLPPRHRLGVAGRTLQGRIEPLAAVVLLPGRRRRARPREQREHAGRDSGPHPPHHRRLRPHFDRPASASRTRSTVRMLVIA